MSDEICAVARKIQCLCQSIPDQPTESIEIPSPIHRRLLAQAGQVEGILEQTSPLSARHIAGVTLAEKSGVECALSLSYVQLYTTSACLVHKKRTAMEDGEDGGPSKSGLYWDEC